LGTERPGDLTAMLNEARAGGPVARERLARASYAELPPAAPGPPTDSTAGDRAGS